MVFPLVADSASFSEIYEIYLEVIIKILTGINFWFAKFRNPKHNGRKDKYYTGAKNYI